MCSYNLIVVDNWFSIVAIYVDIMGGQTRLNYFFIDFEQLSEDNCHSPASDITTSLKRVCTGTKLGTFKICAR